VERDGITLRLRTLLLGVLVAGLIGAGLRSMLVSAPPEPAAGTAAPGASPVRHKSARSAAGAVDAATTFVRQGQRIFDLAPDQRGAALRALAARSAADGYVAQQTRHLAELDGIAQRGQGPLTWDVTPLATRVDALTRTRARVEVWRLGVLSIEGLTAPLAEYTTVAYELVWEDGGWRVWSETQTAGPSPMAHPEATPSSPAEWRAALTGFERYPGREPI
jgi:hypothetical protein